MPNPSHHKQAGLTNKSPLLKQSSSCPYSQFSLRLSASPSDCNWSLPPTDDLSLTSVHCGGITTSSLIEEGGFFPEFKFSSPNDHRQSHVKRVNHCAKTLAYKLRQEELKQKGVNEVKGVIDVEKIPDTSTEKSGKWILGLNMDERGILCHSSSWVNDNLINAGQQLLSSQFPHVGGFENVTLKHTLAFTVQTGEFVQVLNINDSHWVTISTIGCSSNEIYVYDSLPPAFSHDLQRQVAAILVSPLPSLNVR